MAAPIVPDWMKPGASPPGGAPEATPSAAGQQAAPQAPVVPDFMQPKAAPTSTQKARALGDEVLGSGESPTYLRSGLAGIIKGIENFGDLGESMLEPYTPQSLKKAEPGLSSVNEGITGALRSGKKAIENAPGIKEARGWANETHPHSLVGAAVQGAGEIAPMVVGSDLLGPEAAESRLYSGLWGEGASGSLTPAQRMATAAGLTAVGAGSGAGQKAGEDVGAVFSPEGKEVGGIIGSIIGGVAPSAGMYGLSKGMQGLLEVVPASEASRAAWAARNIRYFEPNLGLARDRVERPNSPIFVGRDTVRRGNEGEIIPGSRPTAVQLTQSRGLSRLAHALKETGAGSAYAEQEISQARARAQSLRDLAPPFGDPSAVTGFFKRELLGTTAEADRAEQAARGIQNSYIGRTEGLNGVIQPRELGAAAQTSLASGEAMRAKAEKALYGELETANPTIDMSGLAKPLKAIADDIQKSDADLTAPERAALAKAVKLAGANDATWAKVNEFRVKLNDEIGSSMSPGADGRTMHATRATRRLQQVKAAVDYAMNLAALKAIDENPTLGRAAIKALADNEEAFAEAAGHPLSFANANRSQPGSTENDGSGEGGAPAPNGGGAVPGREGAPAGQPPNPVAGNGGVGPSVPGALGGGERGAPPPQGGVGAPPEGEARPSLTPAHAETYVKALGAHAERMDLYHNKLIDSFLEKSNGKFVMAPEAVIQDMVKGKGGGAMARAIKATSADNPEIMGQFRAAIGLDIRRACFRDGEIIPARLTAWENSHADLLNEMPAMRGVLRHLDETQKLVDEAVQARSTAMRRFETNAIRGVLKDESPEIAMQRLLAGPPHEARAFINRIKRDPGALAGARQAMADVLAKQLLQPAGGSEEAHEIVRIARIKAWLSSDSKMRVLKDVLGANAPKRLEQIVHDYEAYNTLKTSALTAGGSQTEPLKRTIERLHMPKTLLGRAISSITAPVGIAAAALSSGFAGEAAAMGAGGVFRGWRAKQIAQAEEFLSRVLVSQKLFLEVTKPIPKDQALEAKLLRRARAAAVNSYVNGPDATNDGGK